MLHPIEILESRIAPAVFFVSGTNLTVENSSGAVVTGDSIAESATGALLAIHMHPGDSLVYDANGNHKFDAATDYVMFAVKSGQGLAFLTDTNGDSKFEPQDFTGIAVSDGFKGTFTGDLHGDFATMLDPSGNFSATTLAPASIDGLALNGHILGNLVAGQNITGVTAKVPKGGNPLALSITGSIFSGDQFNGNTVSFDGGVTSLTPTYIPAASEAGGIISKINLPGGTNGIFAGDAGVGSGKGGSIIGVTMGGATPVDLQAGSGGNPASGTGGAGGDIIGVKITTYNTGAVHIYGGTGGSPTTGNGGDGGMISGLVFMGLNDQTTLGVTIEGGTGGTGGGTGTGGAGGAISKSMIVLPGAGATDHILGGTGGSAGSGVATGGAGGDITAVSVVAHGSTGNGGSLRSSGLYIYGGRGGTAGTGGAGSVGGAGGSVFGLKLAANGVFSREVKIFGGAGGSGGTNIGDGGRGGDFGHVSAMVGAVLDGFVMEGGKGGQGGSTSGNGGGGGNVSMLAAMNLGYVDGFYCYAGEGGQAIGTTGNGGDAGNTTKGILTNKGGVRGIGIYSDNGGNSSATTGNGGDAGSLSYATINNLAFVGTQDIFMGAYYGGVSGTTGNGGKGGSASHLLLNDTFGTTSGVYIYAGSGGPGKGAGGRGGDAGTLSNAVVNARFAHVDLGYNDFGVGNGGTGTSATGGDGGLITNVSGIAGQLRVQAYQGGNATAGTGGNGGNIDGVKFTVTQFANIIMAGNGGNSTTGTPGDGGSIKNVAIKGDIGDFTAAFGTDLSYKTVGMGGLIAGAGGALNGVLNVALNGSIDHVSANRIATIIAGFADGSDLASGNAVVSITHLKATEIGADLNGNGVWDYTEGGTDSTYQLSDAVGADGDVVIDGLVLVKAGGFAINPVTPLEEIDVS